VVEVEAVEQVLVVPRTAVPGGCDFLGIRAITDADVAALRAAIRDHGGFVDRPVAEDDPSTKQVIPYVIVRDGSEAAERVFLMDRTAAGGDPRLHHRATIGVGGHLNPVDTGADPLDAGLRREWDEELIADWDPVFTPIGFLNDDRNPVGRVHLGVVFAVDAAGRAIAVREQDKLSGRMVAATELAAAWDRMETWSQLVVEALWRRPGA
jgi:predicted NUDIX family phosphoesterase